MLLQTMYANSGIDGNIFRKGPNILVRTLNRDRKKHHTVCLDDRRSMSPTYVFLFHINISQKAPPLLPTLRHDS